MTNIRTQNQNVQIKRKDKIIDKPSLMISPPLFDTKIIPHSFLEKEIEDFEFMPEVTTEKKMARKEVTEHEKSLLGFINFSMIFYFFC